jgi:curved DNA-binding protein
VAVERTLCEVLQVDPRAEAEIVEAAYRRLAQKYHPDVSNAPSAERRMKEINAAYEVLRDPLRRAAYDRDLIEQDADAEPEVSWDDEREDDLWEFAGAAEGDARVSPASALGGGRELRGLRRRALRWLLRPLPAAELRAPASWSGRTGPGGSCGCRCCDGC